MINSDRNTGIILRKECIVYLISYFHLKIHEGTHIFYDNINMRSG